ncbi:hypothetical protein TBLA_0F01580 [Henningerozyma blattae CBS 6284]|uniref:RAM signaling network component n=1 Tax=Henningerozyma blattae (strain ATCC 34711 / CBS 6284 / DSM 70876 / NBRC 10599 / NRRL Y-10934 / UCD 77-7) TaxID=1071380 RepID=I2H5P8_HENB6|nr:hypothetical protein TBLA_0F01580 [Tetrapisispora blattae CBS 6284]CCH61700.1 hypothetical protein TBLA_0F01580 [Tetrapisispora blattae CBS 6284]
MSLLTGVSLRRDSLADHTQTSTMATVKAPTRQGSNGSTSNKTHHSTSSSIGSGVSNSTTDNQTLSGIITAELASQEGSSSYSLKLIGLNLDSISEDDVSLLTKVEKLSLRKNKLTSLPKNFNRLINLRYLDLHGNQFTKIPPILLQCPKLEILDMSSNKLDSLPTANELSDFWLGNLTVLSLKNNNFISIRDFSPITRLSHLSVIEIEGNLIPKDELEAVKKWYASSTASTTTSTAKDEYWAMAIRTYLENNMHTPAQESRVSKASKRMGFINTTSMDQMLSSSSTSQPQPNTPSQSQPPSNQSAQTQAYLPSLSQSHPPSQPQPHLPTQSQTHIPSKSHPHPHNQAHASSHSQPHISTQPHSLQKSRSTSLSEVSSSLSSTKHKSIIKTHITRSSSSSIEINELNTNQSITNEQMTNNELYNHTKYNDYFKRLSVLPEESLLSNEQCQTKHKVSHEELVLACRKLLFCFTECQQNIRKIASFCKDKAVAVNVVSLLYSVRSHIDNLVEVLQQTENEGKSHDQAFIKLCITIINIFKQIMNLLLKNFETFFESNELSFIRMFYMTLLCSYNEMYNAWCFISPPDPKPIKRKQLSIKNNSSTATALTPSPAAANMSSATINSSVSATNIACNSQQQSADLRHASRTRSNSFQTRVSPLALSSTQIQSSSNTLTSINNNNGSNISNNDQNPLLTSTNGNSKIKKPSSIQIPTMANNNFHHLNNINNTNSIPNLSSISPALIPTTQPFWSTQTSTRQTSNPNQNNPSTQASNTNINGSMNTPLTASNSMGQLESNLPSKQHSPHILKSASNGTTSIQPHPHTDSDGSSSAISSSTPSEINIDNQLYQTLSTVIKMVTVVYEQLTSEISKTAFATSMGKQEISKEVTLKIRELTETCRQVLELSKSLNSRLKILMINDNNNDNILLSNSEKLKTWEIINSFLKSIISILANSKILMTDLQGLNDVRPNLASLAKITKDVTVILDLSTYKKISMQSHS